MFILYGLELLINTEKSLRFLRKRNDQLLMIAKITMKK